MSREEIHAQQRRLVALSLLMCPDKAPSKPEDRPTLFGRP